MRWQLLACVLGLASAGGAFAACASNGNSGDDGGGGGGNDATSEGSGDDSGSDGRSFGDGNAGDGSGGDSSRGDSGGDAKPADGSSSDAMGDDGGSDGSVDGSGDAADAADAGDGGNGGDGGDASVCGSQPSLHPGNGTSLYCPFGPDGGAAITCNLPTDQCCIGGLIGNNTYAPSDCESFGTGCTNPLDGGRALECEETIDCAGNNLGSICCASGSTVLDQTCGYYRGSKFKGTTCEQGATCAGGEYQICASAGDCANNQTCTPFKVAGLQLGFCL
jgi:hypothetical protein